MHPLALKGAKTFTTLIFIIGGVALFRDTLFQGQDFDVFWWSARHLIEGAALYDLTRDGAMAFKYPPWIAPVFIPLSLLSLTTAKVIWAFIELLSLGAVAALLLKKGCRFWVVALTTVLFWGIWAVHFLDGQVALPMLAISLWSWEKGWFGAAAFALSMKIFSATALLGFRRMRMNELLFTGGALLILTTPAWINSGSMNPVHLLESWRSAAVSGGDQFGEKVRGRDNQGFPALILRSLQIEAKQSQADWIAALICILGIGGYWFYRSRRLGEFESWMGWLAFVCVIHPLAWFHFFVFSYPLAVITLDRALKSRKQKLIVGTFFAVILITMVTRKSVPILGERLELLSIKAFGVLLLMDMLLLVKKQEVVVQAPLRLVPSQVV